MKHIVVKIMRRIRKMSSLSIFQYDILLTEQFDLIKPASPLSPGYLPFIFYVNDIQISDPPS